MTNDTDGADRGRGGLRDRLSGIEPPADLERRVRRTLESRGLVRQDATHPSIPLPVGGSRRAIWIARVGLLAAGVAIGLLVKGSFGTGDGRPSGAAVAGQYVLLLYGDPADDTGAVHVAREREYGRWASTITDGAKWVGGHELADVVERLGPATEVSSASADRLAGYFVIEAPSRERATEIARSCPHLTYGGRIVIMTIAG